MLRTVYIVLPCLCGPCRLFYVNTVIIRVFHVEIARQVAVIVRSRVRRVIPVKGGIAVLSGTVQESGGGLQTVARSGGIFKDHHRFVSLADTGVAHLAVLVAPVGVIGVGSHQVIDFLGGSVLGPAVSRSRENHEPQFVHIIEFLLHCTVVCK